MKKQRILSMTALGAGLAMLIAVPALADHPGPASGDGVQPEFVAENPTCGDIITGEDIVEFKIDDPSDDTFDQDSFSVDIDVRQTGDGTVFDFVASGGQVLGVVSKGGPDANFYDYRPEGNNDDTSLHSPVNHNNDTFFGLSHISFCLEEAAAPSPSPSPTETATESPTPTPTETQPTVLPTIEETEEEEESEVLGTVERRKTQKPEVLATTGASVTLAWLGVLFVVMGLALRRARGSEPAVALAGDRTTVTDKGILATLALIPMLTAQQLDRWGGDRRPGI